MEGCKKGEKLILIGAVLYLLSEIAIILLMLPLLKAKINLGMINEVQTYVLKWVIRFSLSIIGYIFIYRGSKIVKNIWIFLCVVGLMLCFYYIYLSFSIYYLPFIVILLVNVYILLLSDDVKEMFRIKQSVKISN